MSNPQAKPINQKRGPTTGNNGTPSKRNEFMSEKSRTGSMRSELANMVTSALEGRGRTQFGGRVNPGLEGLHSNTGPKKNPTANGSKLPGKYKSPKQ
jgi:hypothetical protein